MFDDSSQTVSLTTAAARAGIGRTTAYLKANEPDDDGNAWLLPGVRIIRTSARRLRVLKRELDDVLGPQQVAS